MAPALVAVMLVASKVLDAFTDAVAGFIVDKTKTKWGKARPYEIFIIGLWLTTWLMFSTPKSWSTVVKCVWVFIMYALANSVCMTFLNANNTPYVVRAFKGEQITKLTSYGAVVTMLPAFLFNILFPQVLAKIAYSPAGWSRTIAMFAVPLAAIGLLRMIFVPEKYDVDVETEKDPLKFKDVFTLLKTNKYILIIAFMTLVFNFVCNMGVNTYYYTYIVHNIGAMSITSMATIIAIPLAFVFPKLISKSSVAKLMKAGFVIAAIGYLLNFIAGANIPLLTVAAVLTGAGTVPASMLSALVIIQCAEFNEHEGRHRMEGTMSSLVGLASKVGAAVGTGLLGVLLQASGFVADEAKIPASAITMIRMLFTLIPMALYFITALTLNGYNKLDKELPTIMADNERNRKKAQNVPEGATEHMDAANEAMAKTSTDETLATNSTMEEKVKSAEIAAGQAVDKALDQEKQEKKDDK